MGGVLFGVAKNCFLFSNKNNCRPGTATGLGIATAIGVNGN